jgi:hypothetical protein
MTDESTERVDRMILAGLFLFMSWCLTTVMVMVGWTSEIVTSFLWCSSVKATTWGLRPFRGQTRDSRQGP